MLFFPAFPAGSSPTTTRICGTFASMGQRRRRSSQDANKSILPTSGMILRQIKAHSLPAADREAYVAAYSRSGRMRAGWAYFASWPDTAKDFAQMAQKQLTMPVLSIAGEKASAAILTPQMKKVATNVKVIELKGAGHWLMEERPKETMDALIGFL